MVLTKAELIAALQNEVRILLHLATKIDRAQLDFRPTPKQRSTLELLRYLSCMGPVLLKATRAGAFDPAAWTAELQAAEARDFDGTIDTIAAMSDSFALLLDEMVDNELREDIEMFGRRSSKGAFLVNTVLAGYAAYRTQLFVYLKVCGRHELSTMNLWAGMDAPGAA